MTVENNLLNDFMLTEAVLLINIFTLLCHKSVNKTLAYNFQNSSCSHRAICCSYCHIEIEANELGEHENYCGSRTERCEDCGEYVMLKYQQLHQESNHSFLKLNDGNVLELLHFWGTCNHFSYFTLQVFTLVSQLSFPLLPFTSLAM